MEIKLKTCVNKELKYVVGKGANLDSAIQNGILALKFRIMREIGSFKLTDGQYEDPKEKGHWIKIDLGRYQLF